LYYCIVLITLQLGSRSSSETPAAQAVIVAMSPAARKKVAGDRHTNDACRSKAARQKKLDSKKMMEAENIQLKEENEKLKKENSKLKIRIKD
jgi:hypothetical protein